MANNRIYLRCNECGEKLFLGKSFLMGYYWTNYGKLNGDPNSPPLEDELNEFFIKHRYCGDNPTDGDYSIDYETPINTVARKVVLCEECRYGIRRYGKYLCGHWGDPEEREWNDFCSKGEVDGND